MCPSTSRVHVLPNAFYFTWRLRLVPKSLSVCVSVCPHSRVCNMRNPTLRVFVPSLYRQKLFLKNWGRYFLCLVTRVLGQHLEVGLACPLLTLLAVVALLSQQQIHSKGDCASFLVNWSTDGDWQLTEWEARQAGLGARRHLGRRGPAHRACHRSWWPPGETRTARWSRTDEA